MDIVLISSGRDAKLLPPGAEQKVFICLDSITKEEMAKEGRQAYIYDEFIAPAEAKYAQNQVLTILNGWCVREGRDLSDFRGVSLSRAVEHELSENIVTRMRYILAFKALVGKFSPGKLTAFLSRDNDIEGVLEFLAKHYSFALEKIASGGRVQRTIPISEFLTKENPLKITIKGILWGVVIFISGIMAFFRKAGPKKLLLLNESYACALLEYWSSEKAVRERIAAGFIADGFSLGHAAKAMFSNAPELYKLDFCSFDRSAQRELDKAVSETLSYFKDSRWQSMFTCGGFNFSMVFEDYLGVFVPGAFVDAAKKYLALLAKLKKNNPDYVLVPSQVSSLSYLLTMAAKKSGIRSFFLFHGLLPYYSKVENFPGEEPITDFVISWGHGDREYYINSGISPERIFTIGNPFFDKYLALRKKRSAENSSGTVLVLQYSKHQGIISSKESFESEYFIRVMRILDKKGVKKVIFKLHPGRPNPKYYELLKAGLNLKLYIEIVKDMPIDKAILKSDYVIGPFSTAALEAFMLDRNYYCVHLEDSLPASPFDNKLGFVARDIGQLENMLNENRQQPKEKILELFSNIADIDNLPEHSFSAGLLNFFINFN